MYSELFELHANLLRSLAHPRRLEIVQLLRDQSLNVSDIFAMLDLPQANISQHLMILRDAGVVTASREGKHIFYSLAHPHIIESCDLLRDVLIEQNKDTDLAKQLSYTMKDLLPIVHDPVCGMRVSPKTAGYSAKLKDHSYYFCASGCLKKFHERPESYV